MIDTAVTSSKKKSKAYALNAEKWTSGSTARKEEKEFGLQQFKKRLKQDLWKGN